MSEKRSRLRAAFDRLGLTVSARARNLYASLREYKSSEFDGPKLLGDDDTEWITVDCGLDLKQFQNYLSDMGLSSIVLVKQGAFERYKTLYIYNEKELQNLLDKNASLLGRCGWPQKAKDFVYKTSLGRVEEHENKELYTLVSVVFNSGHPDHQARIREYGL